MARPLERRAKLARAVRGGLRSALATSAGLAVASLYGGCAERRGPAAEELAREYQAPVVLYGTTVEGQWREYRSGVDFYFAAIGYLRTDAGRYVIVLTEYGDRLKDFFSDLSWSGFLRSVTSAAREAL